MNIYFLTDPLGIKYITTDPYVLPLNFTFEKIVLGEVRKTKRNKQTNQPKKKKKKKKKKNFVNRFLYHFLIYFLFFFRIFYKS